MTATVRLGDVLSLDRDEVAVDPSASYEIAGVRSFGRGLFDRETIAGAATRYPKLYRLRSDQIVMSRLFAWEGALAHVGAEFDGKFVSSEFPTFTIDTSKADQRYIGHFVRWPGLHDQLSSAGRGLGQRRQRVHAESFLSTKILLPHIDEQRRIAARLDGVDAVAADLQSKAAHADALNDALVVALALRPDLDDATKARAGWIHTALGDVLSPSDRAVPVEPASSFLIAGIYSFGRGLINRGLIQGADTSYATLTRLAAGDVVVSKLNGWEGAVAVVGDEFDGFHVSSEYPTFVPNRARLLPGFFAGIARAPSFWDDLNVSARGSMVRRRRINPAEFLSTRVWLPPLEVQAATAEALETAAEASRSRRTSSERIDALVPAALNEAFAGIS
jgi:type I restriction enzyme S subunit